MSIKLNGKSALVTGGARGIGLACVQALAESGASVTFTARNTASAQIALDTL
ncbi:MAG TPA: SDR family NAD(P)-dependent oxidoreductase, partial [Hellea balneolensis]|nr:SDR family NAD(P)-dependent oxidoreductase [Hellea balneolensis]